MNKLSLPKITPSRLFFTLYILISAATFRHSAHGFASLEGSMAWGALSALAVDVLMILFAHAIRQDGFSWRSGESWGLAIGLSVPAIASVYTQLLFAVTEAQVLDVAPGALWLGETAVNITNIRVVGLPALLPILALVAALMGKHDDKQVVAAEVHATTQAQLEAARKEAAILRKQNAESDVVHSQTVERNRELAAFKAAVTNPDAWKTATSAARMIMTEIHSNGNRPDTAVLASVLGVSKAQIGNVSRKVKAEQEVA